MIDEGISEELATGEDGKEDIEARRLREEEVEMLIARRERGNEAFPVIEGHIGVGFITQDVGGKDGKASKEGAGWCGAGECTEVTRRGGRIAETGSTENLVMVGGVRTVGEHDISDRTGSSAWEGLSTKVAFDEGADHGGVGFEIEVEALSRGEIFSVRVAHAAGKVKELGSIDGWEEQVFCGAAEHAQGVDEAAEEVVGGSELRGFGGREDACAGESFEGGVDARGTQLGMSATVHHLQDLDVVLEVDEAAGAEFGVQATLSEFFVLSPTEGAEVIKVDGVGLIDEFIAQAFDLAAEGWVTADRAEADEREAFVGVGGASGAVVAAELLEASGQGASGAVGTEAKVNAKDTLTFCADAERDLLSEALEKFDVGKSRLAIGLPVVAVDEQELDIGGVTESSTAKLAEAEDGKASFDTGSSARSAVAADEIVVHATCGGADNLFSKDCEVFSEAAEVEIRRNDVIEIDEKNLAIFEVVKARELLVEGVGTGERFREASGDSFGRLGESPASHVGRENGKQGFILLADEIFPEEIAGAEDASKILEGMRIREDFKPLAAAGCLQC